MVTLWTQQSMGVHLHHRGSDCTSKLRSVCFPWCSHPHQDSYSAVTPSPPPPPPIYSGLQQNGHKAPSLKTAKEIVTLVLLKEEGSGATMYFKAIGCTPLLCLHGSRAGATTSQTRQPPAAAHVCMRCRLQNVTNSV